MVHSIFAYRIKSLNVVLLVGLMFASLFLLVASKPVHAAADTCTWTGLGLGADSNTTNSENWTGCDNGTVPQNGDHLVFPDGPTDKEVTLDAALFFESITISGSSYTISPDTSETLGAYRSVTISGNNNTINTRLRLYPTTAMDFTHSGTGTVFSTYMVVQPLAAYTTLNLAIDTDLSVPMIAQTAPSGGSSIDGVNKTGVGTLEMTGEAIGGITANEGVHIQEGTIKCDTIHCLGDDTNEIILADGADPDGPTLHLNGDATVPNPITANTGDGEPGSVIVSANVILEGAMLAETDLNMFVSGDHTLTVSSDVTLEPGVTMALYGSDGYTTNKFVSNGIISGSGGIVVDDAHVTLAGTNTYTGTTELNDTGSGSVVTVKDNNSLGNSSAGTIVNPGSTLNFDNTGSVFYDEPITIAGNGVGGSYPGAVVKTNDYVGLYGGVTLTSDATFHNETAQIFSITSVISGNYDITMTANDDTGGFALQPGTDNTFKNLVATGTQLSINGTGTNSVIPGDLTVNAVNGKLSWIWLNDDNLISDDSVVDLNNDGSEEALLINSGVVDTVGTISGDGTIAMRDADARFSLGGGGVSGTFTGTVEGYTNSQFQIIGGTWTFSGYNTDAGDGFSSYYINGGTFIANAADTSLSLSPFSISSGILGGTEIIGPVSVYAGTIAPGNSPGCLYPAGDVAFNDVTSFLNVEINGTTACSGYDVLNASGNVVLNGAVLNVDILADYDSVYGNEFTIVRGAVVAGTFNGLADGDIFTAGNSSFRINYTSTTVVLTDVTTDDSSTASLLADSGSSIFVVAAAATILVAIASYLIIKRQLSRRRYAR